MENDSFSFTDIQSSVDELIKLLRLDTIEIYNEFSLQHELGIILRNNLSKNWKVQFERNIGYFGIPSENFPKKEIDIVAFDLNTRQKIAFELKYPTNGQYPEQMFKCCQDIKFLEQLVKKGFLAGYFLIIVDDHKFFEGDVPNPIYKYFRRGTPINGIIQKPTGEKNVFITVDGNYSIIWRPISNKLKYALVEIK